jgi:Protein of unknown function (DUF1003)
MSYVSASASLHTQINPICASRLRTAESLVAVHNGGYASASYASGGGGASRVPRIAGDVTAGPALVSCVLVAYAPCVAKLDLPITLQHHPVVMEEQARRAADIQLRIADWITGFAGSMNFVYLHIALFTVWMLFIEKSPWPTLTLIVSLEAIFLSTFVMIGQNRQAAFQQAKADHDFTEQELELKTNTQLTREIHVLTTELHRRFMGIPPGRGRGGRPGHHATRQLPWSASQWVLPYLG